MALTISDKQDIKDLIIETVPGLVQPMFDELISPLKRSFDHIDKRFDDAEQRLKAHDKDFAEVKFLLTETVRRSEHHLLENRVERLERKVFPSD